jgi:hypothetical protein
VSDQLKIIVDPPGGPVTRTLKSRWTFSKEDILEGPAPTITEEDIMSMEKRGVVNTEAEKKAHEQAKKKLGQTNSGRLPSGKPNQANAPKTEGKK